MKKVPTLFERDRANRARVLPQVTPGCEWVLAREGTPTRKFDGTCVRRDDEGNWWTRREVKLNASPPDAFLPVEVDRVTQKVMGWMPAATSPFHKYLLEAISDEKLDRLQLYTWPSGTYELIGPRINGNPEYVKEHLLIAHGSVTVPDLIPPPAGDAFTFLAARLRSLNEQFIVERGGGQFEGVVWHHPDGRMAKLKVRDFA